MKFKVNNSIVRLVIFQRNEILTLFQSKIRKLFGRLLFTILFSRFLNNNYVSKKYYKICYDEYKFLNKFVKLKNCKHILSIGGGVGGLETLLMKNFQNCSLDLIDRNFVSKKIKYSWNEKEAYNSINLTKKFFFDNCKNNNKFKVFDFDKKNFPKKKYDLIFSFFSLDYHYSFNLYKNFLIKWSNKKTIFIFDTVRPNFFKKVFKKIKIINNNMNTIHKSKRLICREINLKLL